mmetsp:Transcript_20299/g.23321  ORF Transcript_20299/g.23321 Transcript_20299/m.23321 type:complete len:119 (+) Transcript_20299:719-1075(+)
MVMYSSVKIGPTPARVRNLFPRPKFVQGASQQPRKKYKETQQTVSVFFLFPRHHHLQQVSWNYKKEGKRYWFDIEIVSLDTAAIVVTTELSFGKTSTNPANPCETSWGDESGCEVWWY